MSQLLDQLMDAPDARLILDKMEQELKRESEQRKAFYDWIREDQKAEFINGEIILHSPVKRKHWKAVMLLSKLLDTYAAVYDLGEVATEKAMIALTRNDYEPDICFWSKEKTNAFDDNTMLHPAPDLVIEVLSKSTAKNDRGIKLKDYAAHNIKEYWIIDPTKRHIEQNTLGDEGEYELKGKFTLSQVIESVVVAGFKIPVVAVFDAQENIKALKSLFG
jgi:Uma2 family endonuclease